MSRQAKKNYHHLKVLAASTPEQTKALLKVSDDALIKTLCECVHNVLQANIPVSSTQKNKIVKHKTHLIKLVDKAVPLEDKRKVLVQHGGNFLTLLLPPVLKVLEQFL